MDIDYALRGAWHYTPPAWYRYQATISELGLADAAGHVLEVGVTNLSITDFVSNDDITVTKVDIDEQWLRQQSEGAVVRANLTQLPFYDDTFDSALTLMTIDWLSERDRRRALEELFRVTGGPIVVGTPIDDPERGFMARELAEELRQCFRQRGVSVPAWLKTENKDIPSIDEFELDDYPSPEIHPFGFTKRMELWLRHPHLTYLVKLLYVLSGESLLRNDRSSNALLVFRR